MLFLTLKLQQIALRAKLRLERMFNLFHLVIVKIILDNVGENFYHVRGIQREIDRDIQRNRRFSFPTTLKLAAQRIKWNFFFSFYF